MSAAAERFFCGDWFGRRVSCALIVMLLIVLCIVFWRIFVRFGICCLAIALFIIKPADVLSHNAHCMILCGFSGILIDAFVSIETIVDPCE